MWVERILLVVNNRERTNTLPQREKDHIRNYFPKLSLALLSRKAVRTWKRKYKVELRMDCEECLFPAGKAVFVQQQLPYYSDRHDTHKPWSPPHSYQSCSFCANSSYPLLLWAVCNRSCSTIYSQQTQQWSHEHEALFFWVCVCRCVDVVEIWSQMVMVWRVSVNLRPYVWFKCFILIVQLLYATNI